METVKRPYEFLARWDQDGRLIGAHVQWRYIIKDGDQVIGESVANAEPVAIEAGKSGFPISDILNELQVSAIATFHEGEAVVRDMKDQNEALSDALNAVQGEKAVLTEKSRDLQVQNEALSEALSRARGEKSVLADELGKLREPGGTSTDAPVVNFNVIEGVVN